MKQVTDKVQVNVPFRMLVESYMETFLSMKLNPEIGIDALSLENYSRNDFKDIADKFHERGRRITVHGPFMDLSPASPDPEIRSVSKKRYDQLLELIPVIKPVTVVCHAGYDHTRHFFMRDEWLEISVGFWGEIAGVLKENGSRMMIENVYESTPEEIEPLVNALRQYQAGVCLDVGHMNVFSSVALSGWIECFGDTIGQFHLHDNNGERDMHLPVGSGNIDFETVFDFIGRVDPILTLEPHEEQDLYRSLSYISKHYGRCF